MRPWFLLLAFAAAPAFAQDGESTADSEIHEEASAEATPWGVQFGGLVDTYYGYDSNNPPTRDRQFTTTAKRHNEFNINLAYLEAQVKGPRVRGRLAMQLGTSVVANYATESNASVGMLMRHVQEAVVGYEILPKLWVDAGIYFSHIGFESFISKDNWLYTRSLMSDYSPYYQSGAKLSYDWGIGLVTEFHFINGWQNISEDNTQKALGIKVAYTPIEMLGLSYSNFFEPGPRSRLFNNFIVKFSPFKVLELAAIVDIGLQHQQIPDTWLPWEVFTLLARIQPFERVGFGVRAERMMDPNQILETTSTAGGFQIWGAALGVDVKLHEHVLWRTEARGLLTADGVFVSSAGVSNVDALGVSSLTLSF